MFWCHLNDIPLPNVAWVMRANSVLIVSSYFFCGSREALLLFFCFNWSNVFTVRIFRGWWRYSRMKYFCKYWLSHWKIVMFCRNLQMIGARKRFNLWAELLIHKKFYLPKKKSSWKKGHEQDEFECIWAFHSYKEHLRCEFCSIACGNGIN